MLRMNVLSKSILHAILCSSLILVSIYGGLWLGVRFYPPLAAVGIFVGFGFGMGYLVWQYNKTHR